MKFELTQMKKLPFVFLVAFTLLVSLTVQAQNEKETYPKITGFVGIIHPLVTLTSSDITTNFKDYYTVGMPIGINIWKNDKIGFSFEIVPTIKSNSEISKVNNILIHPGVLVRLKKGYTFTGRIAFETSGRYGFTPVLTKIIKKYSDHNYYISVPMPVRFGNNHDSSLTIGLQVGIGF
jgi:hypothetical protein